MANQTFKVGDKVRILDVKGICGGEFLEIINGLATVEVVDSDGVVFLKCGDGSPLIIGDDEFKYIEKVSEEENPKPTKNQRIKTLEEAQATLKETVEQLKARVEQLGALVEAQQPKVKISGEAQKVAEEIAESLRQKLGEYVGQTTLTPNQRRKAIIDEAKAFVEETEKKMSALKKNHEGNYTFRETCSTAKFNVNSEKRAVTALVYHKDSGSLLEKAIAKCAPDDVFNADIGKAIALGRALGLDVSKFEMAVQPTEYVEGMFVKDISDDIEQLGERDPEEDGQYGKAFNIVGHGYWLGTTQLTQILDDTEAQY